MAAFIGLVDQEQEKKLKIALLINHVNLVTEAHSARWAFHF